MTVNPERATCGKCDCGHDGLPPTFHFDCPVKRADNARRHEAVESADGPCTLDHDDSDSGARPTSKEDA